MWISHAVPQMTLVSLTTDSIPGLNWILAAAVGIASVLVLKHTFAEQSLCSSAHRVDGKPPGTAQPRMMRIIMVSGNEGAN
jgi:hypothetical protein